MCPAAADVKKAKEGGFHTVQSLIMNPRKVGDGAVLTMLAGGWQARRAASAPPCRLAACVCQNSRTLHARQRPGSLHHLNQPCLHVIYMLAAAACCQGPVRSQGRQAG